MTSTHRLWNIVQVQSSNLIKTGHVNESFNKALTNAAIGYFDKFTSGNANSKATTTYGCNHDHNDDSSLQSSKGTTEDKKSQGKKRRRRNTTSSSTRLTFPTSESQLLRQKYNVNPKTGLTTNDHFFEKQRNNGYCQQTMPTPEVLQLQELLGSEVQRYLSSINNTTVSLCGDPTVKLDMWATVQMGSLAYHADHVHENVYVSGVYYSCIPEGSAPLVLYRPLKEETKDEWVDVHNQYEEDEFVIHPEEGQVVIFPPWLLHGVPPSKSMDSTNSPRVSFAFNLSGYTIGDPWEATRL